MAMNEDLPSRSVLTWRTGCADGPLWYGIEGDLAKAPSHECRAGEEG